MTNSDSKFSEPTAEAIAAARARIAYFGRFLFDRHLTDAAGGNISVRVGNRICITARYSGSQRQWQLEPQDVLVADLDGNILDGKGQISRESKAHFKLHREYADYGTAIIHAHSRNVMIFAALACPMPPVLEATRKFGETPVVNYAPAHHMQLADNVVASFRGREARIKNHAAGTIAPFHGIFVMGKDLEAAFDAVERFDTNAYCIVMGRMLVGAEAQTASMQLMEETISNFKES